MSFASPQDCEDAYYDALDERDLDALMATWEAADDILCLLPMQPPAIGQQAIRGCFAPLLDDDVALDIQVHHIRWVERDSLALHLIEEQVSPPGMPPQKIYALRTYRRDSDGWQLIAHQNAPVPPPNLQPA